MPCEEPPVFVPKPHPSLPRKTATLTRDDASIAQDKKTVTDEFIVASENLKRKNLFPERAVTHADSVARQLAAEELADALGLDNNAELLYVIKQPGRILPSHTLCVLNIYAYIDVLLA